MTSKGRDSGKVKVAGVQTHPQFGEVAVNRERVLRWLQQTAAEGAKLIAFPECALSGYVFDSVEEALPFAESVPGPSTDAVTQACQSLGVWCVLGIFEREDDRLYNTCVLISPDGLQASYRKVHLPHMGVDRFATPGDDAFLVHHAAGLKVGLHICYDGAFPEPARVMTLLGADLLILPTNWPAGAEPLAEHLMACRALENVVYTMAIDRVGEERGTRFIGRSGIFDPLGRTLAFAGPASEEVLYAEIDPARSRDKRIVRKPGAYTDRIGDRRPEFYGLIAADTGKAPRSKGVTSA
jgi:predicted amidohydrolase